MHIPSPSILTFSHFRGGQPPSPLVGEDWDEGEQVSFLSLDEPTQTPLLVA